MHSPDHSTKGTPLALGGTFPQWPLTAGKYEVSGSLSSPFRGAFHLSLTVLVHYRSHWVFSLGGWSPLLPTGFLVSRGTQDARLCTDTYRYRTLTVSGRAFQHVRVSVCTLVASPTTPPGPKTRRFGLFPVRSPLLRESRLISLRRATEMFQFAHCPLPWLYIHQGVSRHHSGGVAPFGISGLIAWMQLPLNVSPVSASFIGPMHLGIRLVLCVACSLSMCVIDHVHLVMNLFGFPCVATGKNTFCFPLLQLIGNWHTV